MFPSSTVGNAYTVLYIISGFYVSVACVVHSSYCDYYVNQSFTLVCLMCVLSNKYPMFLYETRTIDLHKWFKISNGSLGFELLTSPLIIVR